MGKIVLIIIATINPAEQQAAETYVKEVTVLQEQAGAVPLYRFPVHDVFIGELKPDVTAAVEFPSQEAFDQVFKSDAYKTLIPFRDKGFETLHAFVSKQ